MYLGNTSAILVSPSARIRKDVVNKFWCQAGIVKSVPRFLELSLTLVSKSGKACGFFGRQGVLGNNWLYLSLLRLKSTALAFHIPLREPV